VAGSLPLPTIRSVRWPTLETEVLDVRGTGLADTEPVQPEQHGQRGVVPVVLLGGEKEHPELGAIQPANVRCVDLRSANVLSGVRTDEPIDVREPVEATHGRKPTVDGRGCEATLHPGAEQLDVGTARLHDRDAVVDGPLEEAAQVVAARLESAAAVAGNEGDRSKLRLINLVLGPGTRIVVAADSMVVIAGPPRDRKTSQPAAINRRYGARGEAPLGHYVAVQALLLDRATNICLALPEATADDRHPPHRGFLIGKKNFAWFVVDEHGDGRIGSASERHTEKTRSSLPLTPSGSACQSTSPVMAG
jgi:hypothetical protein